jgi:Zn-dependent protease with chaperone function
MQIARNRKIVWPAVLLFVAACAAQSGKEGESGSSSWMPDVSKITSVFSTSDNMLVSDLQPGPYKPSPLAIGEEKDLAQRQGEALGFVRSAPFEQYLATVRSKLVASSGVTGVPGRVVILANPAFTAFSTPDGNLYVSMGCLESIKNEDEAAAILAHELSHVLLAHHTSDIVSQMQKKTQALHEIGLNAKTALLGAAAKTGAKSDKNILANEQVAIDITDKLALPAWGRRQEREADLLGVDLLIRAKYSPGAMVSVLEILQAWEKQNQEAEEAFWNKLKETSLNNPGAALSMTYQRGLELLSVSHPKTEDRITDTVEYLQRHYEDLKPIETHVAPWKAITGRADVSQVLRHYRLAFSAKQKLDKNNPQEAYPAAKESATGNTATHAYPNWVLYRSAKFLNRPKEALDALQRAVKSPEPVPEIYDAMILDYERAGTFPVALDWTNKASAAFGGAPRWTPTKIRLLRKLGRTAEAEALSLSCALDTPDFKRQCQEANKTPAGRPQK